MVKSEEWSILPSRPRLPAGLCIYNDSGLIHIYNSHKENMPMIHTKLTGLVKGVGLMLALIVGNAFAADTSQSPLTLVKDGEPQCTIVLGKTPSAMGVLAASELQWHIEQITGAKIPVVREPSDPAQIKGLPIYLGESLKVRDLGLKNSSFGQREFTVAYFPDAIVLTGCNDEWDPLPENQELKLSLTSPPYMGGNRGTLFATYEFIEANLGVRWFAPGSQNISWPDKSKTLTVTPTGVRRTIAIRDRNAPWTGSINVNAWGVPSPSREEMERYRMRNKAAGGNVITHSFYGWEDRFLKKDSPYFESYHPEYFAKDKLGGQICFTHTGTLAQAIADARQWASGKPAPYKANSGEDFFGLEPLDTPVVCDCETCKPLLGAPEPGFNNGQASYIVWSFADKVARALQETNPGKFVGVLGYSNHADPPRNLDLATNIYVGMAIGLRGMPDPMNDDIKKYNKWLQILPGRISSLWLYPCFPRETAGIQGFIAFPKVEARGLNAQMRMYATDKVRSFMICGQYDTILDDWCLLKFQDNPFVDVEAVIADFFKRYYGPAAVPMQTFYDSIEKLGGWDDKASWDNNGGAGTDERMGQWQRLMDEAAALAVSEPEKSRVANIRDNLWAEMLKGKRIYNHKLKYADDAAAFRKLPPLETNAVKLAAGPKDGDAINVDWSLVVPVKMYRNMVGFPAEVRSGDFYIAHDGVNVYVRITDHVDTSRLIDTGQPWWNDRWEIFTSRQSDRNANLEDRPGWGPYRQIGVRPNATTLDMWSSDKAEFDHWAKQDLKFHNSKTGNEWTFYLTFPMATFSAAGPVVPGEKVYINALAPSEVNDVIALSPPLQPGKYHNVPRHAGFLLEK